MSLIAHAAGRYGAFIWPAYGLSAAIFAWMIGDTLRRATKFRRAAGRRESERAP
jgi:heme exporter protein D